MEKTLNGIQCREARMLLRWNVKDLAYRSNVDVRRIRAFEGLHEPLYYEEMRAIYDIFKQEHIIFKEDSVAIEKHIHASSRSSDPSLYGNLPHMSLQHRANPKAEEVLSRLLGKPPLS